MNPGHFTKAFSVNEFHFFIHEKCLKGENCAKTRDEQLFESVPKIPS